MSSYFCLWRCIKLIEGDIFIKRGKVSVRTHVRNAGRGQFSSNWRHNKNDIIMRTGGGCKRRRRETREWRHNENDVITITAGLWRYADWRHVATGCNAPVKTECYLASADVDMRCRCTLTNICLYLCMNSQCARPGTSSLSLRHQQVSKRLLRVVKLINHRIRFITLKPYYTPCQNLWVG